jgi:hypothetical protein
MNEQKEIINQPKENPARVEDEAVKPTGDIPGEDLTGEDISGEDLQLILLVPTRNLLEIRKEIRDQETYNKLMTVLKSVSRQNETAVQLKKRLMKGGPKMIDVFRQVSRFL